MKKTKKINIKSPKNEIISNIAPYYSILNQTYGWKGAYEKCVSLLKNNNPKIYKKLNNINMYDIPTYIYYKYILINNGCVITDEENTKNELKVIYDTILGTKNKQKVYKSKNTKTTIAMQCTNYIAEIDSHIDQLFSKEYDSLKTLKNTIIGWNLNKNQKMYIFNKFKPLVDELKPIVTKPKKLLNELEIEILDAYNYLKLVEIKKIYECLVDFLNSIKFSIQNKKIRVKRKVLSANDKLKNFRYLNSFEDLGLITQHPEKILKSSELWLYDTSKKIIYHVLSDSVFDISGINILNIKSAKYKRVRKPNEFIKDFKAKTKLGKYSVYNSINTKEYDWKFCRPSKDTIILNTY